MRCGRSLADAPDDPLVVEALGEVSERLVEFLNSAESVHLEELLLQGADEPLDAVVALGLADDGCAGLDAEGLELVLEGVGEPPRGADALNAVGFFSGLAHSDGLRGGGRTPSSRSSICMAWSPTFGLEVVDEAVAVVGLAGLEARLHGGEGLAAKEPQDDLSLAAAQPPSLVVTLAPAPGGCAAEGALCRRFFMVSCIAPSSPKSVSQETVQRNSLRILVEAVNQAAIMFGRRFPEHE